MGTLLIVGRYVEQIAYCSEGNVCVLMDIDQFLLKSGTLASLETTHPFHATNFSVAAVVKVAVEPKNAADLPKLVEGLKRLLKSDPLVRCSTSKETIDDKTGYDEQHTKITVSKSPNLC